MQVLKHIQGELPAWVTDSGSEQADWFNAVLQHLWPFVSSGVEKMIKEKIQPSLDKNTSPVIPSLKFSRVSLGSDAPRIISVN